MDVSKVLQKKRKRKGSEEPEHSGAVRNGRNVSAGEMWIGSLKGKEKRGEKSCEIVKSTKEP